MSDKPLPVAQVKTILYCLDQMKQPIPPAIRDLFINLRPDILLKEWLEDLRKYHERSPQILCADPHINAQEKAKLLKDLFEQHNCVIGVPFQRKAIFQLYDKFVILRDVLRKFSTITPIELLGKLEPRLAKRYEPALDQLPHVKERWTQGDALFYETQKNGSQTTLTRSGHVLNPWIFPKKKVSLSPSVKAKPMDRTKHWRSCKRPHKS